MAIIVPMTKSETLCRVCGFPSEDVLWKGNSPSYLICPACGSEAGFNDENIDSVRSYRQEWYNSGKKWWSD